MNNLGQKKTEVSKNPFFYLNTSDHADCRFRTCDLRVTSALLYQLSHVGIECCP